MQAQRRLAVGKCRLICYNTAVRSLRKGGNILLGLLWFLFWQALGQLIAARAFRSLEAFERVLLGSVCGSLAAIWAPIPFSFLFGFSAASHLAAAAAGAIAAILLRKGFSLPARDELHASWREHLPFAFVLTPFMLLCVVLLLSHTLREMNGALYTGQSGWGDMPMHLGFVTSIAAQGSFPPEYSILPGERLCYPFLCDSVSSSLYLLGTPLRWAYMIPAFFAFAQVFCGFYHLSRAMLHRRAPAQLAFFLFFLNGGLGMIYFTGRQSLRMLLTGFYKTPTNLGDHSIRWVNVIADMLLPQRATLFGWAALFAVLLLLYRAVFCGEDKLFLPAGILGGLLPMIHTHSYLALGLVAACWLVSSAVREKQSRKWLLSWLAFGLPAVAFAVPQLLLWTFHSVGGNEQFLRWHVDWVNEGKENWLWFWLKNVGPLFLLAPLAFVFADRTRRAVFFPALLIFLLCEFVAFQPNVYDNNKLLYVSYALFCILSADLIVRAAEMIRPRFVRITALALLLVLCTNAALFTLAREFVSGTESHAIRLFSASDTAAAAFIRENTAPDSLFLTASNHNNAVAALTGRNVFCGSPSFLFYHGLDYSARLDLEQKLLTDSESFARLHEELGIDYVYLGDYERGIVDCCAAYFDQNYPAVFRSGNVTIYQIN